MRSRGRPGEARRPPVVESALIHLGGSVADDPAVAKELAAYLSEERSKQKEVQL